MKCQEINLNTAFIKPQTLIKYYGYFFISDYVQTELSQSKIR